LYSSVSALQGLTQSCWPGVGASTLRNYLGEALAHLIPGRDQGLDQDQDQDQDQGYHDQQEESFHPGCRLRRP